MSAAMQVVCTTCKAVRDCANESVHGAEAKLKATCQAERALGLKSPMVCNVSYRQNPSPVKHLT